ncbi:DNA polymerase I [Propionimicrobium lymphophilum]|uniref:DNA polymerase I n=1 Tax=Propionimicrobium lymphophilum TaxID=33012 RepID=UPI000424FE89|nr:DNA polymerase I [Propionimicrobium lymphophilum]
MAENRPKLILIDGHSMAFRAFYALPPENFSTNTGQYTNAVYGFTSMLINLLRDEQPTHIAVAFDLSHVTFRTKEYSDYKGTRPETPPEFKGQVDMIREVLTALNIVYVEKENYEADDVIATLSKQANDAGWQTLIVSGDRDSFQLINENTTVLYPKRGVSQMDLMTPEAVEAKYGVSPQRYPELAALVGETSDNLPGVPGVGPKTAAKWIVNYDGLENILANPDQIKGKVGDSLRAHLDDVKRNRKLNRLVRDLELSAGLNDLNMREYDREQVHEIFDALEFRTLRERLFTTFPQEGEEVAEQVEIDGSVLQPGELADWLEENGDLLGMDLEIVEGDINSIALATPDGKAAWFDVAESNSTEENAFANWLADPQKKKVIHSAKTACLACWDRGWQIEGLACDTELAAYLLHPDQRSYQLADLSIRYLGRELKTDEDAGQATLDFGGAEAAEAAMNRAAAVIGFRKALTSELDKVGQVSLLNDVEMPLQKVLAKMEFTGIAVDTDGLEKLRDDYDASVVEAQSKAFESIGHELNLGSPKQLQKVLFEELELPKTKKIKSGYTTDAEALNTLYASTRHPFLEHLLAYRDSIKLRQTVDGLLAAVASDGRIHTTFQQTVTATGRLSSTDPNLQNIPTRTTAGARVRDVFVVGDGFDGLMSADYSQIEMRVMADASGDEHLINAFRSGVDFHTDTAAKVYGVDASEITPQMRAHVKQMNYGLAYGLSAYGLSSRIGVSVAQANELMEDYFATFGQVRDYLEGLVEQARKTGYTQTLLGRRRYLPDLNSSNWRRRQMAERAALNAPIQGSAADIIKIAMLRVDEKLKAGEFKSRMLLQVHDELVLEVAEGEREHVEELVVHEMANAAELKVPLDVSVGYGKTWHSAAH